MKHRAKKAFRGTKGSGRKLLPQRIEKPQTYVMQAEFMLRDRGWYPAADQIIRGYLEDFAKLPWVQVSFVLIEKVKKDGRS